jgi:hypothetical protein
MNWFLRYTHPVFETPADQGGGAPPAAPPTLEQLLQPFDERIATAQTDEEKLPIELEKANARGAFLEQQIHESNLVNWRAEALAQFPNAMPQALAGATQEEILAAAQASHEFVEAKLKEQAPPPAAPTPPAPARPANPAAAAYGAPNASGGQPPASAETQEIDRIWGGLREAYPAKAVNLKEAPVGTGLKPGDDIKLSDLRMDDEWNLMADQAIPGGIAGNR